MNKFHSGDKVKVVKLDTKWPAYVKSLNECLGKTGIIDTKYSESSHVVFDGTDDGWTFKDEWLELVEEVSNGWTGEVVCTYVNYGSLRFFTEGKAYPVYKGILHDDTGVYGTHFTSVNDINRNCKGMYRFIEFKGFTNTGKDANE